MDIKKEKKNYVSPSVKVFTIETGNMMLAASNCNANGYVGSGPYLVDEDEFEIN